MKSLSRLVKSFVILFVLVLLANLLMFGYFSKRKDLVGNEAVMLMYNFSSTEELDKHMDKLSEITTPEVYEKLTIDNEERALNTYLKFKNQPVTVKVIKSGRGYVFYTLDTGSLSSGRKFMFLYDTTMSGKINYVREMETIDFYKGEPLPK